VLATHSLEWLAEKLEKKPPAIEAARLIHQIMLELSLSAKEISKKLGYSRPWVCKRLKLLELPLEVQSLVESRQLPPGTAYIIWTSGLPQSQMVDLAREAAQGRMTREQVEFVTKTKDLLTEDESGVSGPRIRPYRLTVRQFERMIDAEVFPEGHHVELLGGILVDKRAKHEPHNFAVAQLGDDLRGVLPGDWTVREEKPVRLGRFWRPEPDLAVVRGPHERYGREAPSPSDIGLLVEASDTSYAKDRGPKWARYAASGVPAYWITNIPAGVLEVHTNPSGKGRSAVYRETRVFRPGEGVPVVLDGREVGRVDVRRFLP